jgi:hypothetical protein
MHSQNRIGLTALNICVLFLNVFLDVIFAEGWVGQLQCVFQIHILAEAVTAWKNKLQTLALLRSKRIDAISRSIPSMLIQMYTLFTVWESLDYLGVTTLLVSILLSLGGASMTLASIDPSSGKSMFSFSWILLFCYYSVDLMAKVLAYSMLFASVKAFGFLAMGVEWLVRFNLCWRQRVTWKSCRNNFVLSLTFLGSERLLQNAVYDESKEYRKDRALLCHISTVIVTFLALLTFNISTYDTLQHLRNDHVTKPITVLLSFGLLIYVTILLKTSVDEKTFESIITFPFMYLL